MPELIAISLVLVSLLIRRDQPERWRVVGIALDGSVIEECSSRTRVRVYMIDRDGDPCGIAEISKRPSESVEEAILRVHQEQNEDDGVDNSIG